MMKYFRFLLLVSILLLSLFAVPKASAQTSTDIIWQYQTVQSPSNASDLSDELSQEVTKVINSGHLAPFRTLYGEGASTNGQYAWYHSYDVVYTLSAAYPYLPSSLQTQVKTYLKNEMSTYPLWSETYLDPKTGTKREPDTLTDADRNMPNYSARPKMFAMYALWLYAQNTGDWSYINSNWSSITSFYSRNSSEVGKYYSSIAGAIGVARMAQQKGTVDTATKNTVITAIQNGLTAGKNYATFGANAETAFTYSSGERWDYTRRGSYMGFQFLDISPEIGRYFTSDSTLTAAILGTSGTTDFSLDTAEKKYHLWYVAQAPYDVVMYGEGAGTYPELRAMIFPIHAWVLKDSPSQLRKYIDVPDALLGDFYYMQNVTRTLEAHGTICWNDILTSQQSCGNTPTTSPQPTTTPTSTIAPSNTPVAPTATQTPVCKADINQSGTVDLSDYSILVSNFLKTPLLNPSADINGDGRCDLTDYSLLVSSFLKKCL